MSDSTEDMSENIEEQESVASVKETESKGASGSRQITLSIIAICVSIAAFLFSIISLAINYYNQYGKNADITFQQDDKIRCWIEGKKLVFNNTIVSFNNGARYGSIYKINGEIVNGNNKVDFNWSMFVHDENIGLKGQQFLPYTSFDGWAQTILLQGRSASQKTIQFRTEDSLKIIDNGQYLIRFRFYTGADKKPTVVKAGSFILTKNVAEQLSITATRFDSTNRVARKIVSIKLDNINNN